MFENGWIQLFLYLKFNQVMKWESVFCRLQSQLAANANPFSAPLICEQ